jgi:hypothetical protein
MRILLDLQRNTLEFRLRDEGEPTSWERLPATVDIGEAGRLLGVEVDLAGLPEMTESLSGAPGVYDAQSETLYIAQDSVSDPNTRSASLQARAGLDAAGRLLAIEIPRRGVGYEISYPSGNQ